MLHFLYLWNEFKCKSSILIWTSIKFEISLQGCSEFYYCKTLRGEMYIPFQWYIWKRISWYFLFFVIFFLLIFYPTVHTVYLSVHKTFSLRKICLTMQRCVTVLPYLPRHLIGLIKAKQPIAREELQAELLGKGNKQEEEFRMSWSQREKRKEKETVGRWARQTNIEEAGKSDLKNKGKKP